MSIKIIKGSKIYTDTLNGLPSIEAVKNLNIDINEGSYTLIFGPIGSGKTTLLSLLACIIRPTSGDIVFDNLYLSKAKEREISRFREEHIGYIPQKTLMIEDLTVLENILSPNSFLRERKRQLKTYAFGLLERLHLVHKAGLRPFQLSGGEIKKVMIARALAKKPRFIFADEPVSELDQESMNDVVSLFDEQHTRGAAVVIVSHRPFGLRKKFDIYTMKDGKIIEYVQGKNNGLYRRESQKGEGTD